MTPATPVHHDPRFRFIGGKGGVGKTTCAAALAIASARAGAPTLVLSTDPAPSLGDALGVKLTGRPRAVPGVARLHALEVDAPAVMTGWLRERRPLLERIALGGTWLDEEDVSRLLGLSLPGIDEIAALLEIGRLGADSRYARIIVDSAPTGHLLRMLAMPDVLGGVAEIFDRMQHKQRVLVEALRGAWTPDAADALVDEIDGEARRLAGLLRDPGASAVSWVTLPETMSSEEAADALEWLGAHGLTVDTLIVNRLTAPPPQPCRWCSRRRAAERRVLAALRARPVFTGLALRGVPAQPREPRDVRRLAALAAHLSRPLRPGTAPRAAGAGSIRAELPIARSRAAVVERTPQTRLVMFGGKGGVGKTTCASAAALAAARATPDARVLLISTDPAHSLADALGEPASDDPRRLRRGPANLFVRELDASRAFAGVRDRIGAAIDGLLHRGTGAVGVTATAAGDRRAVEDLLRLAPPGIDEIVATVEIVDSLDRSRDGYDIVYMDTAPTGHALRLIEMPSLVHDWVKTLMSILLKYEAVVGVGALGAELLRLSQGLKRLREMLADPKRARFVVVTRTGLLPRAETARLLKRLERARLSSPMVVVNALGAGTCGRCDGEAAMQRRELALLRRAAGPRRELAFAPAELPPPHGAVRLQAWRASWRSGR